MPDLEFQILSAKVKPYAAVPTLSFNLQIKNASENEEVYAAALKCQVLIEATKRQYNGESKEKLVGVFGEPQRWEETVKGLFWTTVTVPVPRFSGRTIIEVPIGCCEDHISAAGKFFYSVKDDEVPLAFLFSGTLFYKDTSGDLQITQVPWHKEAIYKMPAVLWHEMMEIYFPNMKWLQVHKDIFDKLYRLTSLHSFPTIENCLESVIDQALEKSEIKEKQSL